MKQSTSEERPKKDPEPQLRPMVLTRFKHVKRSHWLVFLVGILVVAVIVSVGVVPRLLPSGSDSETLDRILDSDEDGLPDLYEVDGWTTSGGSLYVTDPKKADTDGDGLSDSEEAGELLSSQQEKAVYAGVSDPTRVDSDDDGLNDYAEVHGWSTTREETYFTDPMNPDSDRDTLFDGDEAGSLVEGSDEDLYVGFSNPELKDTDEDGLSDAAEADSSTDPYAADTDGDGLDDYQEVTVVGSDPNDADTDGDGHGDGYEEGNREAQGLDPLFEDVEISAWDYAGDFAKGALAGDAWRADSVAWLAGNLVSRGSSFIPGIGWVIGGVADTRDPIASAVQADWVGAGFSAVGLIPTVGDAAAIPWKAAAFVTRHPELAASVGALIVALNKVPDSIRIDASRQLWKEWDPLLEAGANEQALLQLQKSGRNNLDSLGSAMKREGHSIGPPSRFMANGLAGEANIERMLSAHGEIVETQVRASTVGCVEVCNANARIFDAVVDDIAHVPKVGFNTLTSSVRAQISSDVYLMETGVIDSAHWHFYPSAHTSQLGASKPVLDLLQEKGVSFTIHVPTTK